MFMGSRRTKITIHGVPVDIYEDRIGAFFSKFGEVEQVNAFIEKSGIWRYGVAGYIKPEKIWGNSKHSLMQSKDDGGRV